jgi:hypothetical protein
MEDPRARGGARRWRRLGCFPWCGGDAHAAATAAVAPAPPRIAAAAAAAADEHAASTAAPPAALEAQAAPTPSLPDPTLHFPSFGSFSAPGAPTAAAAPYSPPAAGGVAGGGAHTVPLPQHEPAAPEQQGSGNDPYAAVLPPPKRVERKATGAGAGALIAPSPGDDWAAPQDQQADDGTAPGARGGEAGLREAQPALQAAQVLVADMPAGRGTEALSWTPLAALPGRGRAGPAMAHEWEDVLQRRWGGDTAVAVPAKPTAAPDIAAAHQAVPQQSAASGGPPLLTLRQHQVVTQLLEAQAVRRQRRVSFTFGAPDAAPGSRVAQELLPGIMSTLPHAPATAPRRPAAVPRGALSGTQTQAATGSSGSQQQGQHEAALMSVSDEEWLTAAPRAALPPPQLPTTAIMHPQLLAATPLETPRAPRGFGSYLLPCADDEGPAAGTQGGCPSGWGNDCTRHSLPLVPAVLSLLPPVPPRLTVTAPASPSSAAGCYNPRYQLDMPQLRPLRTSSAASGRPGSGATASADGAGGGEGASPGVRSRGASPASAASSSRPTTPRARVSSPGVGVGTPGLGQEVSDGEECLPTRVGLMPGARDNRGGGGGAAEGVGQSSGGWGDAALPQAVRGQHTEAPAAAAARRGPCRGPATGGHAVGPLPGEGPSSAQQGGGGGNGSAPPSVGPAGGGGAASRRAARQVFIIDVNAGEQLLVGSEADSVSLDSDEVPSKVGDVRT